MTAIPVTSSIAIDDGELQETATRAGGPGGQHVNTTDSAVILKFDVANSPNLPDAVKMRLVELAGSRMTREGVLVLRGERSDYVQPEHRPLFRALFPRSRFLSLRGAGHWLHADAPDKFREVVEAFLSA